MPDPTGAGLSEEERRAAFAAELARPTTPSGRALRPSVPPKVVWYVALAFAVLGLGGVVLDHFFGGPVDTSAPTTTAATTTTTLAPGHPLPVTALTYIGLKPIAPSPAPAVSLTDTAGRRWRLSGQRGRVVILAFYSVDCSDVCPVLGTELREALALLGPRPVEVAIVNTDPRNLLVEPRPPALASTGLAGRRDVAFLTGSLAQLDAVWTRYGVSVDVTAAGRVAHNDVLYFIDPRGRLRALALPFGNESRRGGYRLPAADEARFARGVADEAGSLTR
jgi:cytochrome oxidase Cu insertion factor (SCO1/SenC/PrrC family)